MQNILNNNLNFHDTAIPKAGAKNHKIISTYLSQLKEKKWFEKTLVNELIASFPAVEMDNFLSTAKTVSLAAGDSIYRHGDTIRFVYFPLTAVFSQYQVLEDGRTCEIAMIGKEGCVGLSGMIYPSAANCWTEVSVAGRALKIDSEVFRQEFKTNTILQNRAIEYMHFYAEQLSQRIVCNYFHQVKERFCSWLLMLQERREENKFAFTQEGIARMLGVHRPSLSCVAKELQEQKLISYSRGKIEILNRRELQLSACVCGLRTKYQVVQ